MPSFAPVAIVGQAALLPGSPDAAAFADNVLAGRSLLTPAPAGRWRVGMAHVMGTPADRADRTWSDAGGYVQGFPWQDGVAPSLDGLDPLARWMFHCGRQALGEAGIEGRQPRGMAIFGNLSFPSEGMTAWGEAELLRQAGRGAGGGDPRDHFMSGHPVALVARALGLGSGFALDAACASSLYAVKLGCDALATGRADVVLAGAVNRADSLFLHVGFTALGALSKTGQSRPFHREADGLVPAEGCAAVVLMRLDDAVRAGRPILGVIRGVGLSNDGRARGLLAPSPEGQVRAMRRAWTAAGLDPRDVDLVECHATGTPTGDRAEVESLSRLLDGATTRVPIGSLKSNLGHLITVAGVAGMLKVLAGMRAGVKPPTLHTDAPLDELAASPLRLLTAAEPWDPRATGAVDGSGSTRVRRAGVSAFGFGGNNAHVVLEEHRPGSPVHVAVRAPAAEIVVVGVAAQAGSAADRAAFARVVYGLETPALRVDEVALGMGGLKFPPNDLRDSLGQQTLALAVAQAALRDAAAGRADWSPGERDRVGVVIGMGTAGEVTGYGLRWRMPELVPAAGPEVRDAVLPTLRAEHVVGTMPNIPANRVNVQGDLAGFGYTVSAEELSGIVAIQVAIDALRAGEIDAAVVGAVDLATDPRAAAALARLGVTTPPADAAAALVLKRRADAERDGDRVWARIDDVRLGVGPAEGPAVECPPACGHPHAAVGMLALTAAVVACRVGGLPGTGAPADHLVARATALDGTAGEVRVSTVTKGAALAPNDRAALTARLAADPVAPTAPPLLSLPVPRVDVARLAAALATVPAASGPVASPPVASPSTASPPTASPLVASPSAASPSSPPPAAAPPRAALEPSMSTTPQVMAPAPTLPPVSRQTVFHETAHPGENAPVKAVDDRVSANVSVGVLPAVSASVSPCVSGSVSVNVSPGPAPAVVPAAPAPVSAGAPSGAPSALAAILAQQQRVAALHQGYLERAAAVHREFTTSQAASLELLARAAVSAPAAGRPGPASGSPVVRPASPASAPVQGVRPAVSAPAPVSAAPVAGAVLSPAPPPVGAKAAFPPTTPMAPASPAAAAPAKAAPVAATSSATQAFAAIAAAGTPAASPASPATRTAPLPVAAPVAAAVAAPSAPKPTTSPAAVPAGLPAPATFPGPKLDRAALHAGSSGSITTLFGPAFAELDAFHRVVRMPEPPLLLADRVLGIQGEALTFGKGTIWTETDVAESSWYLHDRRIPGGVMIEAGQADLLLISWQGIDRLNRSERIYRLLGCELRYHGPLPEVGETLRYAIHVDGHAKLGDVRMFFFHYDSWARPTGTDGGAPGAPVGTPRLSVRQGQAGFFSDAELAASGGVLWEAATAEVDLAGPMDAPVVTPSRTVLDADALTALAEGRVADAFGPSHRLTRAHTWTPRISGKPRPVPRPDGRVVDTSLLFLDRVELDLTGGPWGRGYLRGEQDIRPDLWFFDGHFKNDPCMPGTLMFEGCLQAMQIYMTALGFTIDRDGWRFEPAKEETFKLRCRGQVTPTSKKLVYEIFVQAVSNGDRPYVRAQVMCTIDGLKCFHADPLTVELVPDWPLSRMVEEANAAKAQDEREAAAAIARGEKPPAWGYYSLLACAWGQPSHAFGPMYTPFDNHRKVARLPGPPYHFMSRVLTTTGAQGSIKPGTGCVVEYDVPDDVWYFRDQGAVMPFSVLLEAALQPCGWLSSWTGCVLDQPWVPGEPPVATKDFLFRNLDGNGVIHADVLPGSGPLRTAVTLTRLDRSGGMVICAFKVAMTQGDRKIYDLDTVFGFFPPAAFANQAGVPHGDEDKAWLASPSDFLVDLRERPARYFEGPLKMVGGDLLMLDRVTGYWPQGGTAGLGKWRGEKRVDPAEWMFKAHFYSDPVQPGSLGIEAMIQLLQFHCVHTGVGAGVPEPRFEGIGTGRPTVWRYRGQVVPKAKLAQIELDIVEVRENEVVAEAQLWVDGKRIYYAKNLAMKVVPQPPPRRGGPPPTGLVPVTPPASAPPASTALSPAPAATSTATTTPVAPTPAPPATAPAIQWVQVPPPVDHCPTWVIPSLPGMTMAMLALQAGGATTLHDGTALRWCTFPDGPRPVALRREGPLVTLYAGTITDGHLHATDPFFRAKVGGPVTPTEPSALRDAAPGETGEALYASGALFHGPSFQVVERVVARGTNGTTLLLRPAPPDKLLDGATHGVPHDDLRSWDAALPDGMVGYPHVIRHLALFGAPPSGPVRAEVRYLGLSPSRRPRLAAWLYDGERLAAQVEWEEALLPKGRIGSAPPADRRAFLTGSFVPGLTLARIEGDKAVLSAKVAGESDWLPGTLYRVYGTDTASAIAAKELEGQRLGVHPRMIGLEPVSGGFWAHDRHHPLATRRLAVVGDTVKGTDEARAQDLDGMVRWWRRNLECGAWPGEDLLRALAAYGLADLHLHDPDALAALRGRPCLYLGNHETYVESVLFAAVMAWHQDLPLDALAKAEHREGWLGSLHALLGQWPGVSFPGFMVYFDQADPASLAGLVGRTCASRSLLVHVEGTRQVQNGAPIDKISSLWADVAVERKIPIVPVAFRGGVDGAKVDLPVRAQSHHVGSPILPEELAALPYAERRRRIAAAIDALAGDGGAPTPWAGLSPEKGIGEALTRWTADKQRAGTLAPFRAKPAKTAEGDWFGKLKGFVG